MEIGPARVREARQHLSARYWTQTVIDNGQLPWFWLHNRHKMEALAPSATKLAETVWHTVVGGGKPF